MLLAWNGVRVDQIRLQRRMRKSLPLDPIVGNGGLPPIWGDPNRGCVGRAAGGGPAGGFGVYEGPVRELASRYGAELVDLSRKPAGLVYERLTSGVPVLAWVGLSEGPYRRWRTPAGRTITANMGEHAVVLTRLVGNLIAVNDPLTGSRLTWSKDGFEIRWKRLGRRALSF